MADLIWPRDIVPNEVEWRLLDSTGVFSSPLSGTVRTVSRPGTNRWGVRLNFRNLRNAQRYRVTALVAALRGQSNRILISDASSVRRGTFPAAELFPNNAFQNGTTGYTVDAKGALSAADRILRSTRAVSGLSNVVMSPAATVVSFAPHVTRYFLRAGRLASGTKFTIGAGSTTSGYEYGSQSASDSFGMYSHAFVPSGTTAYAALQSSPASGPIAGDYLDILYASMSRCALVDGGQNLLLQSDDLTTTWSASALSISANATAAPDGTTTADSLIEDSATNTHYIEQTATVASTVEELSFGIALKAGNRPFARVQMIESFGTTAASVYFDLANGLIGTIATGANWLNTRAFMTSLGDGWYRCHVVAKKNTGSATSVACRIGLATADNTDSYAGNGSNLIWAWRGTLAQSAMPTRLVETTSASTSGAVQSGGALYLKGLPVSTSGLLEVGDMGQIGTELKRSIARLDSDAAGLGYWEFEPTIRSSPADDAPVIFQEPMGKFLMNTDEVVWPTRPGKFSDFSLDFVEAVGN